MMKVREALKSDMPQVLELIIELAIFEKEPDAVEISVEDLEREGFGENPLFTCFVAEYRSNPILRTQWCQCFKNVACSAYG